MALVYMTPDQVDVDRPIKEVFPGANILVRIRLETDDVHVVFTGGNPPPSGKEGFPKSDVTFSEPLVITVVPWEASPGCKTVIINGVAYERCS